MGEFMDTRSRNIGLTLLLVGHFLITGAFSILNPLGEAPDEADHWAYVVYLANEQTLPVGPKVTQSKHPPLYHGTAALVASLGKPTNDFLRANPDMQISASQATTTDPWSPNFFIHTTRENYPWQGGALSFHLARLWSTLLSTLTILATFLLGHAAFPKQPLVAWGGAGLLAFLPEFAFIGGSVNNDNGIALLGTLSLLAGIRMMEPECSLRQIWWAPLVIGGGLLTKSSVMGLWPAISLALIVGSVQAWQRGVRSIVWRSLYTHLFIFGGGLLIAAPWFLRNFDLYGDPLGMGLVRQTIDLRTMPWTLADTVWLLRGWYLSFIGKLGGAGHIPLPTWIYAGYGLVTSFAVAGLGIHMWQQRRRFQWLPIFIFLLAILGIAGAMWRYSLIALGTDQGRLLYPAIAPLILLIALGIVTLCSPHWAKVAILTLIAWSGITGITALIAVQVPTFAPFPSTDRASVAANVTVTQFDAPIRYAELDLIGWQPDVDPAFYWQLNQETERDLRTVLRIIAEDGSLVWEKRRSPGRGLWSTDHWPLDHVVRDAYEIQWPDWATAGRYRVELGVRSYGGELITETGDDYRLIGWIERNF